MPAGRITEGVCCVFLWVVMTSGPSPGPFVVTCSSLTFTRLRPQRLHRAARARAEPPHSHRYLFMNSTHVRWRCRATIDSIFESRASAPNNTNVKPPACSPLCHASARAFAHNKHYFPGFTTRSSRSPSLALWVAGGFGRRTFAHSPCVRRRLLK